MKKHLLAATLACALTAGLIAPSFAQTTSSPGSGAGNVSGAQQDTTGGNPSNSPNGGTTGAGGTTGMGNGGTGSGGTGMGGASGAGK